MKTFRIKIPQGDVFCVANNYDHAKRQAKDLSRTLADGHLRWRKVASSTERAPRQFVLGMAAVKEWETRFGNRLGATQ